MSSSVPSRADLVFLFIKVQAALRGADGMKRELVSLRLAPLINAKCRKSLKGMVIALAMSEDAEPVTVLQGALQSCSVGGNMVVVSGRSIYNQ